MRRRRRRHHLGTRPHRDATSALAVEYLCTVPAVPIAVVSLNTAALAPRGSTLALAARSALCVQAQNLAGVVHVFALTARRGDSRHAQVRWGVKQSREMARQRLRYRRFALQADSHYGTKAVHFARRVRLGGTAQLVTSTACTHVLPLSSPQPRKMVCCTRRIPRHGKLLTYPIHHSQSCSSSCTWGRPSCKDKGKAIVRHRVLPARSRHRKIFRRA